MADRIHGVAVDAGSGLAASLRDARGAAADSNDPVTFKRAVLEELGQGATTVLLDAKFGPGLLQSYPEGCARMLAYEADVYKISNADRITILPDDLSLEVFPDLGVEQLKFFMYYAPDDDLGIRWDDPELAIAWPEDTLPPLLSNKDTQLPLLPDAEVYP